MEAMLKLCPTQERKEERRKRSKEIYTDASLNMESMGVHRKAMNLEQAEIPLCHLEPK